MRKGEVNKPCFLCYGVKNEVLVSTVDVIHSWGVPELGIKVDAVPGRVNSGIIVPMEIGFFYGFCYELCGAGHREMPIVAVSLPAELYKDCLDYLAVEQYSKTVFKNGPHYKKGGARLTKIATALDKY